MTLRKYIPVDMLQVRTTLGRTFFLPLYLDRHRIVIVIVIISCFQIPQSAETLAEAITAIRMCDRLCTLIEHQMHCIKNDKFVIFAMIEHVFIQVCLSNNR